MPRVNDQTPKAKRTGPRTEDVSPDLLASLVRSSADAIVIETLDGITTYWNPAAEQRYGYRAEEVIGHSLSVRIPPHRLGETESLLARARGGEHAINVESERWTRDGRRIDVSLSISPVWDEAGEIVGTSAIVRDIAARKTTEQALAASEALL
jgi:PAS domain S-box-containing protein